MNAHIPQSVEAATELREIAAVPLQIVSPRDSAPIVSVVQDTLVGANRFTRPDVLFTRREAMNLLVHAKRWDGKLPEPVVVDPVPKWSGQQLLSALLPPISLQMPNSSYSDADKENPASQNMVKIVNGKIIQGILDSSVFSKQLVHVMYNDYGPELTVDFLDSLQAMIANFLMDSGFSVGISDLIADEGTNTDINEALKKITSSIEEQILQLHTGLFENSSGRTNQEEFEGKLMGALNKATSEAGKIGLKSLSSINRMTNMVKAGSKGSDTNVSQMIAALGQQAIEGKRVPNGFQHRTLPHYKRFDDSAKARGFISSSFIKGLNPDEFFFHAMSGREGLIDTAVKTADTGYMQRQIRVALEDLISQHDGSVRDVTGNILQCRYGEDGINATKLENQMLPLAEMSDADIRDIYAADGDSREEEYIAAAMADRKMLVEGVFGSKMNKGVKYPVHLDRILRFGGIPANFHLAERTDASPAIVTAAEALDAQDRILARTHKDNRLWGALLRYYLAPRNLQKLNYTKPALDAVVEEVIVKHMKSWVEPGQPVGVIAAQSIGEPATQMSCAKDTLVCVTNGKDVRFYGPVKDFVDSILDQHKDSVQVIGDDSVVLPLEEEYFIVGVSHDEKTSWKRISEVSRHPANGGLVKVTTRSGRSTTATLSHSFLKRSKTGIVPVLGSDLKLGMRIPVARIVPEVPNALTEVVHGSSTFKLTKSFGWLCGAYLADGSLNGNTVRISKVHPVVEKKLAELANEYSWPFSVHEYQGEYGPSKDNNIQSKDLKDFLLKEFGTGSFQKHVGAHVFHANKDYIAGIIGGYFDGDGNVSVERQQIRASSRSKDLIKGINALLGYMGVFATMSTEKTAKQPGKVSYTLNVLKKFAQVFKDQVGFCLSEKAEALNHVIDYTERDDKHSAQEMIDKIPELGDVIAETGKLLRMPGQSRTYGRWTKKESIGRQTLEQYIQDFRDMMGVHVDEHARSQVETNLSILESALHADVIWDEIVDLTYMEDPKEFVYDFTVPGNDSFMVDDNILVHNTLNTFHLAGVAAKSNVTRGVPRLKELLKATRNPKAVELTIPLRRDLRNKKEEARRVAQELEFTLLQDLVTTARIYYDPRDDATIVAEDADWLAFMAAYEKAAQPAPAVQQADPLTESEYEAPEAPKKSPWILRFELDRERMFAKSITMDDIAYVLRSKFAADLSTIYTDYNSQNLVFRMRLSADQKNPVDDLNTLKLLQNKVLTGTAIRGIPGLRSVNYQKVSDIMELQDGKYAPVDQYILSTDGSNFLDVLCHPDVDPTRVISSNVHDMFENLGIEATRAILYKEMSTLFEESGTNVNYRHVGLLVDKMCTKGKLMSVDRYGINKNDIGPLAKMSFEQTEDIALRAAQFGERDPVLGVSANVMLGAPIRAGTAFTEILLDEAAAIELANTTPEQTFAIRPSAGPQAFSMDDIDNALYADDNSDCAPARIRMDVALPPMMETIPEEIPDVEITVLEA